MKLYLVIVIGYNNFVMPYKITAPRSTQAIIKAKHLFYASHPTTVIIKISYFLSNDIQKHEA